MTFSTFRMECWRYRVRVCLAGVLAVACLSANAAVSSEAAAVDETDSRCGPPPPIDGGRHDYRQRLLDPELARLSDLQVQYHLHPAQEAIRANDPINVFGNLDFILRHWPNYQPALKLLVDYEASGPTKGRVTRAECYLVWARQFVPDDPVAWSSSGYYYWKKGNPDRAKAMWQQALQLDPQSAELHYNLGLAYFELRDYGKAAEHARVAYGAGYPLPGLRNKLAVAGHWPTK